MLIIIYLPVLNLLFTCVFCFEEDVNLKVPQLIKKYGYPVEVHTVTTLDGYKLTLHRIPHGKELSTSDVPVLVTHSLMCSSASWVDNLNDSLGFILADEKYDVWLGNFRGNSYTSHSVYSRNDPKLWDYSADDMVEFDVPAFINYIQSVTGYSKILYIGHSLGSTVGLAFFSSQMEYNDKVAGFVALSPVSMVYVTSPALNFIRSNTALFNTVSTFLDFKRFLYIPPTILKIGFPVCSADEICDDTIFLSAGYNAKLQNSSRFSVYASHCTDGTSMKNMRLIIQQNSKRNIFTKFDYGKTDNIRRYGSDKPPAYNLSAITVPIAVFSSLNDALASPLDIALLKRQLRSLFSHEILSDPLFNHVDFIWLHPAKEILYGKVVKALRDMWGQRTVNSNDTKLTNL